MAKIPNLTRNISSSGCNSNPIGWELVNSIELFYPTRSTFTRTCKTRPIRVIKRKKNLTRLHTLHTHTPDTVRQGHTVTITNTQKNRLTHTQHKVTDSCTHNTNLSEQILTHNPQWTLFNPREKLTPNSQPRSRDLLQTVVICCSICCRDLLPWSAADCRDLLLQSCDLLPWYVAPSTAMIYCHDLLPTIVIHCSNLAASNPTCVFAVICCSFHPLWLCNFSKLKFSIHGI